MHDRTETNIIYPPLYPACSRRSRAQQLLQDIKNRVPSARAKRLSAIAKVRHGPDGQLAAIAGVTKTEPEGIGRDYGVDLGQRLDIMAAQYA